MANTDRVSGSAGFQATDVEIAEARGFSIAERPLPAVVVNIKDSVYGRIFTLIHEFTHVLLNRGGICDVDEGADNDHEDVEIFCNHVAGATLVPRDVLLRSEHVAGKRGPTTCRMTSCDHWHGHSTRVEKRFCVACSRSISPRRLIIEKSGVISSRSTRSVRLSKLKGLRLTIGFRLAAPDRCSLNW